MYIDDLYGVTISSLEPKTNNTGDYKYDVALSFAGEERDFVSEVAKQLRKQHVKVFFDEYKKIDLWGRT